MSKQRWVIILFVGLLGSSAWTQEQLPTTYDLRKVGADSLTQTNRIIADSGPDQTAVMMATVPQEQASTVKGNAALQSRVVRNATPFTYYLHINNQKVTELDRAGKVVREFRDQNLQPWIAYRR